MNEFTLTVEATRRMDVSKVGVAPSSKTESMESGSFGDGCKFVRQSTKLSRLWQVATFNFGVRSVAKKARGRISNRAKKCINISSLTKASRGPIAMSAWGAAMEMVPRQCAAMVNIDAATTRGDAAMWYWAAAVVLCDAARRGAKAADAAN
ncbi:hypothetical protein DFH06DRAFT_1147001 [Mycena polygramma]|nr:hypothetical protein DFH06DRAFT_1147001 [Mycena polygramma]